MRSVMRGMCRVVSAVAVAVVSSFGCAADRSTAKGKGTAQDAAKESSMVPVEVILVDADATGYGTFQSHNQKVVSGRSGIFMTHIRRRNEPYTAQQWRLSWSTDGGKSFRTVYETTQATNPPVLEMDDEGNLYLVRVDFIDGNGYLYRFRPGDGYSTPVVSVIPGGSAGKYAMMLDSPRRQLYYFAHNNTFHVVGLDGTVRHSGTLLRDGSNAVLQYPLLSLDEKGVLHAAWTTQKHGVYLYWDIHYMASSDGGRTWQTMKGEPLTLPIVADDTGPTDRITLDDEFEVHTWLSSFLVRGEKAHFLYLAQTTPPRQHYMRYDLKTGEREIDTFDRLAGESISLRGLDGLLATSAGDANAPLYCVMSAEGRLGCLISYDDGTTWHDHALSDGRYNLYAVGGCRHITAEGHIIGTFTDSRGSGHDAGEPSRVCFYKVKAGAAATRAL